MAPARQDSHSRSEPSDDGLLRGVVRYQPLWLATSMSQLLCSAYSGGRRAGRVRAARPAAAHRGDQTLRPARPEPARSQATGCVDLGEQVRRDEKSADGEEDIDPDIAAGQPIGPEVKQHHRANRDSAQSLDVGANTTPARRVRGDLVHGRRMRDGHVPNLTDGHARMSARSTPDGRPVAVEVWLVCGGREGTRTPDLSRVRRAL